MSSFFATALTVLALAQGITPSPAAAPPAGGLTPAEVAELVARRQPVVFVDVRSAKSFARRHITGAVSVPRDRLDAFATQADPKSTLVVYCACPHDESSSEAVARLRQLHRLKNAFYLKGGLDHWIMEGRPFELGTPSAQP